MRPTILLAAATLALPASLAAQSPLSFTCGKPSAHAHALSATTLYHTPANENSPAFGFDLSTAPTSFDHHTCTGDKPFFFSVALPDGSYTVTLALGSPTLPTNTTVRGEARRLFVNQLQLPAKKSATVSFNVHIRTPTIYPRDPNPAIKVPLQRVKLKPRELGVLEWDEKLTLEFNGDHPSVQSITIAPTPRNVPTLYLAGDSTVVDQDNEPWAAWGQMIPAFFTPALTVANEAESGETIRSFISENRLSKIFSTIQPGDFLMIQFAHNDQKPGPGYVPAATDYKDFLRLYIREARAHGATPILVTSMNRRSFDSDGHITHTLRGYPEAMREIAAEQSVALIDLNAISKTLFETIGPEGTLHVFVHYPAGTFPHNPETVADDTHFNNYGAYLLAQAVIQSIRDQHLPLERFLRPNIPPFDPTHPQPFSTFTLPPSPNLSFTAPYGR